MQYKKSWFDKGCTHCSRLSQFLTDLRTEYPDYYNLPVPPIGPEDAKLLIVGLAPGMHGANRTGRPFTGDHAGLLLYQTLYRLGLSSQADALSADDGLQLYHCRISNAVKCLPPQNKPTTDEIKICNQYIQAEINALPQGAVILALGSIAHNAVLRATGNTLSSFKFAHAACHQLDGVILLDSYHCSRYNTQTKRLTEEMFENVFKKAVALIL